MFKLSLLALQKCRNIGSFVTEMRQTILMSSAGCYKKARDERAFLGFGAF